MKRDSKLLQLLNAGLQTTHEGEHIPRPFMLRVRDYMRRQNNVDSLKVSIETMYSFAKTLQRRAAESSSSLTAQAARRLVDMSARFYKVFKELRGKAIDNARLRAQKAFQGLMGRGQTAGALAALAQPNAWVSSKLSVSLRAAAA